MIQVAATFSVIVTGPIAVVLVIAGLGIFAGTGARQSVHEFIDISTVVVDFLDWNDHLLLSATYDSDESEDDAGVKEPPGRPMARWNNLPGEARRHGSEKYSALFVFRPVSV